MKPSALGKQLFVMPMEDGERWMIAIFNRRGQWDMSRTGFASKAAAQKERKKLIRIHERIVAIIHRAARQLMEKRR